MNSLLYRRADLTAQQLILEGGTLGRGLKLYRPRGKVNLGPLVKEMVGGGSPLNQQGEVRKPNQIKDDRQSLQTALRVTWELKKQGWGFLGRGGRSAGWEGKCSCKHVGSLR